MGEGKWRDERQLAAGGTRLTVRGDNPQKSSTILKIMVISFAEDERMKPHKVKRIADFLEKLAVVGIAMSIYQGNWIGLLAIPIFLVSLWLTKEQ